MGELPENTELVYANWVRINANLVDVSIDFGYNEEPFMGPPGSFPVRVALSWEQAKGLAELLDNNLRLYEENIGKIREFADDEEEAHDDR